MHFFPRLLAAAALALLTASPVLAEKGIALQGKEAKTDAASGRRIALVVGNSAYRHAGVLANPARDAELMARTLKQVGFELHGGGAQTDLSRVALDQAIESFGNFLRAGDVALFYYSGHGLQVAGENYLVPVDADIQKEAEVRVKTVPVNLLFAKLDGIPGAVNLVILDACRNNPFVRSFRSSAGGLAAVSAPTGTLVAFSTGPGQVAEDGSGKNSAYTAALAKYIREPGLRVEDVFKRVRSEVSSATKGTQTPWENTSLTGDFAFIEGDALALKKAELAAAGEAKKGELDALLKMEAEAKKQQEKEQAEIAKGQAEIARLDAEIAAMKQRLGAGTATGNDSLQNMLAMVRQKEAQARQLEELRKKREGEEAKRQAEIIRLQEEQKHRRREKLEKDLAAYQEIANSPYGKDMAEAAWASLLQGYPQAKGLGRGKVDILREVVVDDTSLSDIYMREERLSAEKKKKHDEEIKNYLAEKERKNAIHTDSLISFNKSDGTIIDTKNGIVWKVGPSKPMHYNKAIDFAKENGYRLPDKKLINDFIERISAFKPGFNLGDNYWYWTSSKDGKWGVYTVSGNNRERPSETVYNQYYILMYK